MSDLIDRAEALRAIDDLPNCYNGYSDAYDKDYIMGVLDALPSAQPEQTVCEYCHKDSDGYVFPLDKNGHAYISQGKLCLKANGWHGEAKINYCPICGRRLLHE